MSYEHEDEDGLFDSDDDEEVPAPPPEDETPPPTSQIFKPSRIQESDDDDEEEDAEEASKAEDDDDDEEEEEDGAAMFDRVNKKRKKDKKRSKSDQQSKKKRPRKVASFFLDEADVADDDEEEELDEEREKSGEKVLAEDERAAIEAVRRRHEQQRKFQGMTDEEIAAEIEQRHRQQEYTRPSDLRYAPAEGGFIPQGQVMQQALLPSINDPAIYMVKVANGKEQLVVRSILLKAIETFKATGRNTIKTAFCTSSKGYVYIEAIAEPFAREILTGLRLVIQSSFTKVPIDQMTAVLNVTVKKKPIKKGQLVRFKRGPLKGDLALVVDIMEGGERAFVQAVPRPDYSNKDKKLSTSRPPQRLLDLEEARKQGHEVSRKRHTTYRSAEIFDFFNGDYYKKGYLMKEVTVNTFLSTVDVAPKLTELRMFQELKSTRAGGDEEYDDEESASVVTGDDDESSMSSSMTAMKELTEHLKGLEDEKKRGILFLPGDIVQVTGGELINMIGQVVSMDASSRLVNLRALNENTLGDVTVEAALLMKHIQPGQHIKVTSGPSVGQTGRVVNVTTNAGENLAVILTDGTKVEIVCNVENLQVSEEVNQGLDSLMGYELYDLVDVSTSEVGVIIRIGTETLRILLNTGVSKDLRPLELLGKRNVRAGVVSALDSLSAQIQVGDTVRVKEGPFKDKSGIVKHIYKATIFIQCTTYNKDSGIFAVRARITNLVGKEKKSMLDSMAMPAPRATLNGAADSKKNVNKTVRIIKGGHKGLLARIIGVKDKENVLFYDLELLAKLKKITLEADKTTLVEEDTTRQTGTARSYAEEIFTSETPMHASQTPMYAGAETPLYGGNDTPGHDSNPFLYSAADEEEPELPPPVSLPVAAPAAPRQSRFSDAAAPVSTLSNSGWHESSYSATAASNSYSYGGGNASGYSPIPSVHTPGWETASSMSPSTASWGSQTPQYSRDASAGISRDLIPGVVVDIEHGPYKQQLGIIESRCSQSGMYDVRLRNKTSLMMSLHHTEVSVYPPRKGDSVIILAGIKAGRKGILKRVQDVDAFVDFGADGSVDMVRFSSIAWIEEEEYPSSSQYRY